MEVVIRCQCGWETRGTEDQVYEAAVAHGRDVHNMVPTREQVMAMASPVK